MKPNPSKHRSRRLRKKLHLDEFQTMGFEVKFTTKPGIDQSQADALFDAFIDEAMENNSLYCGGGGGRPDYHFLVEKGDKSVSEEEREAVSKWLAGREDVARFEVGPLADSWYPDQE